MPNGEKYFSVWLVLAIVYWIFPFEKIEILSFGFVLMRLLDRWSSIILLKKSISCRLNKKKLLSTGKEDLTMIFFCLFHSLLQRYLLSMEGKNKVNTIISSPSFLFLVHSFHEDCSSMSSFWTTFSTWSFHIFTTSTISR